MIQNLIFVFVALLFTTALSFAGTIQPTERAEWTLPSVAPVVGQTYRVQISLKDLTNAISGLSMKIKYPISALRLESAASLKSGAWVPTSALTMWNVGPTSTDYVNQNGSVSVAITSQSDWVGTGGVIAELTFRVQAGLTGQATWPIELSEMELTSSAFDIRSLRAVTVQVTRDGSVVHLTQQPQSVVGVEGETVQLSVIATGSPTPTYQWFKDGNAVPGGTNAALTLANVRPAIIGDYFAVASNAAGSVTSSVASLSIKGVDSSIWKGLVAYYPFNGNVKDESGNGNNGQLIAGSFAPDRFGSQTGTLDLNGVDQYVTIPNFTAIDNAEQATFSCWVKSPAIGNKDDTGGNPIFMRWLSGGSYAGPVGLIVSETRGKVGTSVIGGFGTESPTAPMISDQWQQMIVVFDGRKVNPSERLKHYVNGVGGFFNDYAAANPLRLGGVGVVTYIGRYAWAPISFKGKIDDVRIYNRALSDAEVKSLYSYESTPPASGAVPDGMALIPAGTFQMGDDRVPEASPVHSVTISAYAMDQKEVSIELWEKIRSWGNAHGYDLSTGGSYGPNRPVGDCSWYDIVKWNNARSEMEGHIPAYYEDSGFKVIYRSGKKDPEGVKWDTGYRLPTEAEWERAARGGVSGKLYPWGTDLVSREFANYSSNSRTVSVGSYQPNSYGLYDMAGNVWEWCWDWKDYYSAGATVNPRGRLEGGERVVRGGGYDQNGNEIGVAVRYNYNPNSGGDRYGFRSVYPMTVIPVSLTQQPQSVVAVEGETLELSVTATGSPTPTYQWFKDGNALPSATNAALTLANLRPAMIGNYTAVVSNAAGSVTSSVASLSIKGVDSGIWKGLVAYYPFNGNANDESGNGNHCENNGVQFVAGRSGAVSKSAQFDGQSSYLEILKSNEGLNVVGELTVSFWSKTSQTSSCMLLSFGDQINYGGGGVLVGLNRVKGPELSFASRGKWPDNNIKVNDSIWHHISLVFKNDGYLVCIDGNFVDFGNSIVGPLSWRGSRTIGKANNMNGYFYQGLLDEIRIYNRALSDPEVKALYDFESTPPVPTVTLAPVATSAVAGQTLTLTAGIAGANLAYRWQKDGVDLQASTRVEGVTSQTLTIQGVVASDTGSYRLTATNLTGSATTPAAVVTVLVPVAITQQPQSQVGVEGETVQLTVTATGSPSPTFQWLKNGKTIAGANQPTLSLANFAEADAGTYSVLVSNAVNAVTSTEAVVTYQAAIKILANGNPVTGTVRTLNPLSIELSFAKSDWILFYTLDGSEPNFLSTPYQEAFTVAEPASLRVVAYDGLYQNSYLGNPLSIRFLKPQTIDWADPGSVRFGDTVTLKVASSSGLPVSVSVVSGPATLTGTALKTTGTGEVVLQALQSGTDDFAPANAQRTITVSPARQTLTWPVLADQKFGNPPLGVAVTAQSGLPVVLTVASGKASVKGTTVTLSGGGEVVLRAEQSGNANYEAISEVRSFKVAKAEQTLTVPTIANRTFNPQPFTPSAVVSSGLPVKFTVLSGPAVIEQGAVKLTGVGSVLLRSEQPGNDDYEATLPVDKTFVVSKGDQTLTFDAVGGRTFGDSAVTLTAKSSSGLSVSYRVVSGPGTIAGGSLTLTGAGTVLVQAVQAGDANYNPAAANQSIVVAKAAQSITFPALANVGYSTNATVLNATSSSGLAVAYRVIQGAATLSGSALSLSAVGAVSVAADQAGDGNYLPAISVTNAFIVARGDQTIAFTAIGDQVLGTASITLKGTSSAGLPVIFQLVSGPATVSSGALTLLGEGTVTVRAKQLGSPLYNPLQVDQTFVIRKLTTLAVTISGNQGGTVAVSPLKEQYAPTDTVTLTATASSGFVFAGWSGDVTGSANPATLTMSAMRAVTVAFKDIQAPVLTWEVPAAGTTGVEQVRLSGTASDNVGVTAALWSRDGGAAQALSLQANGAFVIENLVLLPGTNRFAVIARDAAGNETKIERDVIWIPLRVLQVANAASVQEGQRMVFVVQLVSPGDVAGLTFNLKYDPTYLVDPKMEWGALVGQSVNNVNIGTIGQISGGFALAGTGLPEGTNLVATVSFRARSVPVPLATSLQPSIVSLSSPSGSTLLTGNAVVAGEGQIVVRKIKGDNNANQRVDIGDATVISRLEIGLEEKRSWDVALNDLNESQTLDSGDVVKALRIVVGMDVQPGPMGTAKRLPRAVAMEPAPMSTHYSAELALLDGPTIQIGRPYRVAVKLKAGQGDLTGLSFSLKYPASLELKERAIAAGVPTDALPAWNVSGNRAKLAVIRPKTWAAHSGTVAVFTFEATPEAAKQVTLPIRLEDLEVADVDEGLSAMPSVWLEIGGGLTAAPELRVRRVEGEALSLEVVGSEGLPMVLEGSVDMTAWTETQRLTGQGTGTPVKVTLQPDPNVQAKFWRVRVR